MERMLLHDKEIMDTINGTIAEIQTEREKYEKSIANLDELKKNQETIVAELESSRAEKAASVAASQSEAWAAQAAYDEMEDMNKELEKKILALQNPGGGHGTGTYAWPLPNNSSISSEYKNRVNPITGKHEKHTGIDVRAPSGTAIHAADSGVVILAKWSGGYGNCTIIDHGNGMSTLYAHQSRLGASVGQKVEKGEVMGYVGTTGNSTGNHLHFEVRKNGKHLNPWGYVTKP